MDSTNTHYIIIPTNSSQSLKIGEVLNFYIAMHHSSLSVFMTNKMASDTIKHYELLNLKVAKQTNRIFSSLLSLDGLVQSCMTPSQSLLDETAAFYAEQGTTPLLFTTSVL